MMRWILSTHVQPKAQRLARQGSVIVYSFYSQRNMSKQSYINTEGEQAIGATQSGLISWRPSLHIQRGVHTVIFVVFFSWRRLVLLSFEDSFVRQGCRTRFLEFVNISRVRHIACARFRRSRIIHFVNSIDSSLVRGFSDFVGARIEQSSAR